MTQSSFHNSPDEPSPERKTEPGADRIGFVGIGNMGAPMSACIARAGFRLTVYDLHAEAAKAHAGRIGARAAAGLEELGRSCDIVVTMLPTGAIVRQVLLEQGLADALAPGSLVIDMSSSEPVGSQEMAAELASRKIGFVDAPVSGAVPRATAGTLAIMIGSDDAALTARARPVLSAMGDRLFETGKVGTGHAMKALNNYLAAVGFAAGAEALIAAERFGLDTRAALDIVNVSTGRNFSTEATLKSEVLTGRFASGFGLGLLAKDVRIAAGLAEAVGVELPLLACTREWWDAAEERVGPQKDHTLAFRAWDGGS